MWLIIGALVAVAGGLLIALPSLAKRRILVRSERVRRSLGPKRPLAAFTRLVGLLLFYVGIVLVAA